MMKLVSMLLTLCMVFCMLTVPAAADDLPVVKLDVGTTETYDDTNYKVAQIPLFSGRKTGSTS